MDHKSAMVLEMREKGQFPLSIATSLAFEGAFGIVEEGPRPPKPPIDSYREVWVNIRTLFRNLYGSMKREDVDKLLPEDFAIAIYEEMLVIKGILDQRTSGRVKTVFYANNYRSLTRLYPHALFRDVKTERQKLYSGLENRTIEVLLKNYQGDGRIQIMDFDTNLTGNNENALMLTNYPLDLVANKNFGDIALLESHTGAVKKPHQWHTKLKGGNDLIRIPFNKMTIQLFGDSGDMFAPYPTEYRKAVLSAADSNKWTQTTQKDRILLSIQLLKMPQVEGLVRKMYAS